MPGHDPEPGGLKHAGAAGYLRGGFSIVKASGRIPFSIWCQLTGAAIGNPACDRGAQAPIAVVPRPAAHPDPRATPTSLHG